MKDVMYQWRAVFEASVLDVDYRVCGCKWSGVLEDSKRMNCVIICSHIHVPLNFFLFGGRG